MRLSTLLLLLVGFLIGVSAGLAACGWLYGRGTAPPIPPSPVLPRWSLASFGSSLRGDDAAQARVQALERALSSGGQTDFDGILLFATAVPATWLRRTDLWELSVMVAGGEKRTYPLTFWTSFSNRTVLATTHTRSFQLTEGPWIYHYTAYVDEQGQAVADYSWLDMSPEIGRGGDPTEGLSRRPKPPSGMFVAGRLNSIPVAIELRSQSATTGTGK